jgi:hypothetical protein
MNGDTLMRRSAILALVLSMAAASGTHAAPNCNALLSEGCACAAPIAPDRPVGKLTGIEGDVRKTGRGEYTPLASETEDLNPDDGVVIGDGGKAYLTAGSNCQRLELRPRTSLVVREVDGCACVALVGSEGIQPLETGSTGEGAGDAALAAGFLGGTVGAILLLSQHHCTDNTAGSDPDCSSMSP